MSYKGILKVILSIALSVVFFNYQEEFSDDATRAFLFALCFSLIVFSILAFPVFDSFHQTKLGLNRKIFGNLIAIFLSGAFTYLIFENYSNYFFDDTAFTLRYLDNFWDGYFYHYNKLDPPVFGISSFIFGIFTGFWCWLHLLTPEQSILLTSYLGTICLSFLVLKIWQQQIKDAELIILAWFAVIFSSKMFLNVIPSGMESPFHVSILFAALLFFLLDRSKLMWLFLALSVISKLDAVPLVLVTGVFYLLIKRKELFPLSLKNRHVKEILIYAVIPVVLWVITAFIVFGSPLPQSAYSKIYFHAHPNDYWFPFLTYYVQDPTKKIIFWIFVGLFTTHIVYALIKGISTGLKQLVFGTSFIATLALFYFYNPGEKMQWYYVLPDLLMALQFVQSFAVFLSLVPYKILRVLLTSTGFVYLILFVGADNIGGKYWMDDYLGHVERERNEIGIYIGNVLGEKDTLVSNHALIARHVKGYVIDMSGLNSKFATNYKLNMDSLLNDLHPKWGIYHTSPNYASQMCSHGYFPFRTFYDITDYSYPEWTLFKRAEPNSVNNFVPIDSSMIQGSKLNLEGSISRYSTDSISFKIGIMDAKEAIVFCGIRRSYDIFDLQIDQYQNDKLMDTQKVTIKAIGDYSEDSKFTEALQIKRFSADINKINIFMPGNGGQFILINPFLFTKK